MGRTINWVARALAAATAAAIPATALGTAAPASATTHFAVDADTVVLGASSTSSFKAFDGRVDSFEDGTSIRAELTGHFVGHGTLKATWVFYDSTTVTNSDYTAGLDHPIDFTSPAGKTVVRFTFAYFANDGSVDQETDYVGDSPRSTGSCSRLDQDTANLAPSGFASFTGTVFSGCDGTGRLYANPIGTVQWAGAAGTSDQVQFLFSYVDGSVELKTTPAVSASSPTADVHAVSNLTKQVMFVTVRIVRFGGTQSNTTIPQTTVKFGETVL